VTHDQSQTESAATAALAPLAEIPTWVTLLFAGAVGLAYTFSLGIGALAEPDEARYAEIAREMLARHDWVTPTLNYVKYFEKPPLVYWLTMIVFRLFGISDWLARVVPVACTFSTLALTGILGRQAYGRWVALVGVAVLATSPLMFAMGQTLTLDPALTLFLTATLVCFWFGYHQASWQRVLYRAMYVNIALGVLTKGPVTVVLSGAIVVAFLIVRGDWRAIRRLLDPVGIGLFVVVAVPWFVLVSVRNPEFINFFIVDQHLKRFLTSEEHQQAIWFFLPFTFIGLIPWSIGLLTVAREWPPVARLRDWSAGTWFCAIWAVVVVGFFSFSASKLVTYILPALPPLALLCARMLQATLATGAPLGRRLSWCFTALGWSMLAGGCVVGVLVLQHKAALLHFNVETAQIMGGIIASLFAGSLVMVVTGSRMRHTQGAARELAVAMGGWLLLLCVAMMGRDVTFSYRELGGIIRARAQPADQVVIYRHYVQGIPFYTQRRAVLACGRGELAFGSQQGDQSAFFWSDDVKLIDAWASPTRLFLVINRAELDGLRPQLPSPPIEIAAEGKKVVVVNHPL
jgi:4-amino-4-deoxy-L-arabinose transferase-like glycosyltransferase